LTPLQGEKEQATKLTERTINDYGLIYQHLFNSSARRKRTADQADGAKHQRLWLIGQPLFKPFRLNPGVALG